MDANSFLKRIILIGLVSALPTFVSVASPGGGGHSSGGSGGGHSSSGSGSGHSSSGVSGGHSSTGMSGGHSSAANSGHSLSTSKGGHSSDPSTGPATVVGGRSVSGSSAHSSSVRSKPVPVVNVQRFGSGYGHGDVSGEDYMWRRHHRQLNRVPSKDSSN